VAKNIEVEDLGLCPCGQRIYANVKRGAVAHDLPDCVMFRELEPNEFLAYVRRSRGIPDAPPAR